MKKHLVCIGFTLLFAFAAKAQIERGVPLPNIELMPELAQDDTIYTIVQTPPQFPGGAKSLHKFLIKNLRYPKKAQEAGIEGKVHVKFIVEKDGSLSNIEILKGMASCEACNAEAIRLIKSMPKWEVGKQNGNPVRVQYQIPVLFKLKN